MQPEVSILTPSYQQGMYIEQTLRSVEEQGLGDRLEHLVIDGGSTDGTLEVLERYSPRVRWVSESDRGQAHAVNKGIAASHGRILGWLNSDDLYEPGAVAHALRLFELHPDVDVLYGDAIHIDAEGRFLESYPTRDWDYEALEQTCYLSQPAVFFRRSVPERFGGLDEALRYCMDYEYWLRIGEHVRFLRVPRRLAATRLHEAAKTVSARVAVHEEIVAMFERRLGYAPLRWLYLLARERALLRGGRSDQTAAYAWALLTTTWSGLRASRAHRPLRDVSAFARWWIGERGRTFRRTGRRRRDGGESPDAPNERARDPG